MKLVNVDIGDMARVKSLRHTILAAAMIARASSSRADSSVTVTLNSQGQDEANRLSVSVPELIQRVRDKMDEIFRPRAFLRCFARSPTPVRSRIAVSASTTSPMKAI